MLTPPNVGQRERILAMGSFATGKTTGWLSIARWAEATGSSPHFYVIDTDAAVEHMVALGDWPGDRIHVWPVFEWAEYEAAMNEILPRLTSQDWLVCDFVSTAWESIQDWYVSQVYKQSIDEFFLDARMAAKQGNPLDGWRDWSIINRVYKSWANKLIYQNDAHLYLTAQAETLRDTDSREMRAQFGPIGMRPRGQKHLAHQVHTILALQSMRPGEITMTTVKDRERLKVEYAPLNDFTLDYLVGVAGWLL